MDDALRSLRGVVGKIYVSHSRKVSTGDYGSLGFEAGIEFQPAQDANIEETTAVLEAYVKARVDVALGSKARAEALFPQTGNQRMADDDAMAQEAYAKLLQGAKSPQEKADSGHAGMLETPEIQEVKIAKYAVSVVPDGKYRLELFPLIAGKPGKYAELKMVADKERTWQALQPVWSDVEVVPSEGEVKWVAEWKQGREYEGKDGKKKHYKDLVALRID